MAKNAAGNVITPTPNIYTAISAALSINKTNTTTSKILGYPNPTSGKFSLQLDGSKATKTTVKI